MDLGRKTQYFARRRGKPSQFGEIHAQIYDVALDLLTAPGVFSYKRLDLGTSLLIQSLDVDSGDLVLDLGCGYGAVAVACSLRGAKVVGVDVNSWATWLARKNLERYARAPWMVVLGDLFGPFKGKFDVVVSNPPIRAGRSTVRSIVQGSAKYLREGGRLSLVVRTRMGARTLSSLMARVFGGVEEVSKKSGYRVLRSQRRGGRED